MRQKTIFTLITGLFVATGAFGQGLGGPARLLWIKDVQTSLKLTPDQVNQAKDLSQELQHKYGAEYAQLYQLKGVERAKKAARIQAKVAVETDEVLGHVLKPWQRNRLKQIALQVMGVQALADAGVQEALEITPEQKTKIRSIALAANRDLLAAVAEAKDGFDEAAKKIDERRKEALEKALSELTADQVATWNKLIGKPFDFNVDQLFTILNEDNPQEKQENP